MFTESPPSQGNTSASSGFIADTMDSRPSSPAVDQTVSQEFGSGASRRSSGNRTASAPDNPISAEARTLNAFTKEPDKVSQDDIIGVASPDLASGGQPACPPNVPVASLQESGAGIVFPEAQRTSSPTPEVPDTVENKMLDVLTKIYERMEMEGQQDEKPRRTRSGYPRNAPFKKTHFGMPKQRVNQWQQLNSGNDDYEQIFPEDAYGEETGPNARVFRVYNEEAAAYDNDMIGQASDSSDVLLVFAGLFSAVITTFVVQTSQALEPDEAAISNSLLSEIAYLLRAGGNITMLENVEPAVTDMKPSRTDLWVNALWFTSLTLSLATALFAVLTKQWLRNYMVSTSGTIRDRSHIRQFRFAGMQKWHVLGIIGILPILLHLALGVFLAGLVVFLIPRSLALGCVIGGLTGIVYLLYFATNLFPVFYVQCPYRTAFSEFLNVLYFQRGMGYPQLIRLVHYTALAVCLFIIISAIRARHYYSADGLIALPAILVVVVFMFSTLSLSIPLLPISRTAPSWIRTIHTLHVLRALPGLRSLRRKEADLVQQTRISNSLSLHVIAWLMDNSSSPSVHSVAVQAIGGLSLSQLDRARELGNGVSSWDFLPKESAVDSPRLERLARGCTVLMRNPEEFDLFNDSRDPDDIEGLVSALSSSSPNPEVVGLTNRLLGPSLEDVKLAPYAWINLLSATQRSPAQKDLDLLTLCAKALQDADGWQHLTSDQDVMNRALISVALSRSPKMILQLFKDYDMIPTLPLDLSPVSLHFRESRVFSLIPKSVLRLFVDYDENNLSPLGIRLRALLALHCFLELKSSSSSVTLPLDSSIELLCSIWNIIEAMFFTQQKHITLHDCVVLYHATTRCLAETPLLTGYQWMTSDKLSIYCQYVLLSRRISIHWAKKRFRSFVARSTEKELMQDFLTRLGDIAFPVNTVTLCDVFVSDTQSEVCWNWIAALRNDFEGAYVKFIDADVLCHYRRVEVPTDLVEAFISGLARQRSTNWSLRRRKEDSKWILDTLKYLHHPDNLFTACQLLSNNKHAIITLARLQPESDAWEFCCAKLKDWVWRPDLEETLRGREDALNALYTFFENRRRRKEFLHRFNPMEILRGARRRSDPDDVELQQLTTAANGVPDPLPTQQATSEGHPALPSIVITMPGGCTDNMDSTSPQPVGNLQPSDPASDTQSEPQEITSTNQPDPTLVGEILNIGSPDGSIHHGHGSKEFSTGQTESMRRGWKEVKVEEND